MLADNSIFLKKNCSHLLAQEEYRKEGSKLKSSFSLFFSISGGRHFLHLCSASAEVELCMYVSSLFCVVSWNEWNTETGAYG